MVGENVKGIHDQDGYFGAISMIAFLSKFYDFVVNQVKDLQCYLLNNSRVCLRQTYVAAYT